MGEFPALSEQDIAAIAAQRREDIPSPPPDFARLDWMVCSS